MRTDDLIVDLASRAAPVAVLARPGARFVAWWLVSIACALFAVMAFGPKPQLHEYLGQPEFVAIAILAGWTAALAAAASLVLAVPGAERLPVLRSTAVALALAWLLIAIGATVRSGNGLAGAADWPICYIRVVAIGLIPTIVLFRMLRRAAPLRLMWTGTLALIAGLATGALAVQFICPVDNPAHSLLGHVGPVFSIALIGAFVAPPFLNIRKISRDNPTDRSRS
jgi:hypothetical protein